MDETKKFYLVAMYAVKPDSELVEIVDQEDGSHISRMREGWLGDPHVTAVWHHRLSPFAVLAYSEEQARELGREKLMEWCPVEKGWMNLLVQVKEYPRDVLAALLEEVSPAVDGDEQTPPEIVM